MRTLALLLAGAAIALSTQVTLRELWFRGAAADSEAVTAVPTTDTAPSTGNAGVGPGAAPATTADTPSRAGATAANPTGPAANTTTGAPAPSSTTGATAATSSHGFAIFRGTKMPTGVLMVVDPNVYFVVPPGFAVMRESGSQLQLFAEDVQIGVVVTTGDRLRAHKDPRASIEAFAARNHLAVATIREHGPDRLIAVMTGTTDDGKPKESMMLMHVEPKRRVTVIVSSDGDRVGDPEVQDLVDECFHGRLLMP